jgi:hypothetical protein
MDFSFQIKHLHETTDYTSKRGFLYRSGPVVHHPVSSQDSQSHEVLPVTPSLLTFLHILSSGHRHAVPITSIERRVTVLTRRAENGVPSIKLSSGDTVIARKLAAVIA